MTSDLSAYERWMVSSNLRTVRETGVPVGEQAALLRANGYPRVADALTTVPDGAHRTGEKLYKIKRFYRDDEGRNGEVIERGLTLAEAQAHCQDESTHAYDEAGVVWFDGYDEE